MSVDPFELPEQARKIRDREAKEIARRTAEALSESPSATAALSIVCKLLSLRQAYLGSVGEHYSVQDLEGILVVDELDDKLLRGILDVLHSVEKQAKQPPAKPAEAFLEQKLPRVVREMPQYAVAFVLLYMMRNAFGEFEKLLEEEHEVTPAELERAFARFLVDLVERYIETRDRPVQRHLSDVDREYSAVGRMKCKCSEEKYKVTMQSLHFAGDGKAFDRLDLLCGNCGNRRTVTFDLPYFKDMYQL